MTSRALIPVLAAAALAPAASAAHARTLTFGSDLSRPATITHSHGADTLFWQRTLPNGRSGRVPVSGQVLSIRLKGIAHSTPGGPPPDNQVDFRVLKRLSRGRLRTDHSTQPFRMPVDGDPNQITTFRPTNFCAGKGDILTFADEGGFVPGFYGHGVPFQVLAGAPGGVTEMFHRGASGPTGQNGYVFKPDTSRKGVELLMQVTIATGPDAVWYCKGGTKGLPPQLGVRGGTLRVDERHRAGIAVFCHRLRPVRKGGRAVLKPGGACRVSVSVSSGGVKVARGGARIAGHKTGHVPLRLTSAGRRRLGGGGVSAVASVRLKGGGTYRSAVTLRR
jgi:hypothetical protein